MKGKDVTVLLMPLRTMCGGLEKKKKTLTKTVPRKSGN